MTDQHSTPYFSQYPHHTRSCQTFPPLTVSYTINNTSTIPLIPNFTPLVRRKTGKVRPYSIITKPQLQDHHNIKQTCQYCTRRNPSQNKPARLDYQTYHLISHRRKNSKPHASHPIPKLPTSPSPPLSSPPTRLFPIPQDPPPNHPSIPPKAAFPFPLPPSKPQPSIPQPPTPNPTQHQNSLQANHIEQLKAKQSAHFNKHPRIPQTQTQTQTQTP